MARQEIVKIDGIKGVFVLAEGEYISDQSFDPESGEPETLYYTGLWRPVDWKSESTPKYFVDNGDEPQEFFEDSSWEPIKKESVIYLYRMVL